MSVKRTFSIMRRVLKQIRHDRRTLGMILVMPVLILTFFILAFSGEVKGIKVVVVDLDNSKLSRTILANLEDEDLRIVKRTEVGEARQLVVKGEVWAAITFPEGLHKGLNSRLILRDTSSQIPDVTLILDNSQPQISGVVRKALGEAIQITLQDAYGIEAVIPLAEEHVYGDNVENIDYLTPGVMGLVVLMITFILTILTIVREKNAGTLERLLVTPLRPQELVLGYLGAFGLVSVLQSTILLLSAIVVFQINVRGGILLVFAILVLLAIGFQGLGILLSGLAESEFQAVQFMPIVVIVSLLLSGALWPLEALPVVLRPLAYLIPLTYAVHSLRGVILMGWGWGEIMIDIGVLLFFALGTTALSTLALKKR